MSEDLSEERHRPDLFSLSNARLQDLVAELEASDDMPSTHESTTRRRQISTLLISETIRLVRLGNQKELADGAVVLARVAASGCSSCSGDELIRRRVEAAAIVVSAAASPSSRGGELQVLRSWKGMALRATALVYRSNESSMQRSDLRATLGLEESHLSHLLGDLEAAGLLVRIAHGRSVTLHLGPTGRQPHVEQVLAQEVARQDKADREVAHLTRTRRPAPRPTHDVARRQQHQARPINLLTGDAPTVVPA